MHEYLTDHKYKNTFTEDLWEALAKASSKPVHDIMSTWTKQMGYPVLTVRNYSNIEEGGGGGENKFSYLLRSLYGYVLYILSIFTK